MDNYFTTIEPFYKVAKKFRLFPMSFEEPVRKGNLKFTKFSIIRTIATFGFLLDMNGMIIHNHITYQSENQPFLSLMFWSWFLIQKEDVFYNLKLSTVIINHLPLILSVTKIFKIMEDISCKN